MAFNTSSNQNYGSSGSGYRPQNTGNRKGSKPEIVPVKPEILFVEGDNINPDLVGKLAEDIVQYFTQKENSKERDITSAQLRRFYGEIKGYSNQLKNDADYKKLYPMIKMLKSMAYYAYDRGKIPLKFANFLVGRINQITEDPKTFKAVALHFEAVVGFMYGKGLVSK